MTTSNKGRRLIEDWFPVNEISIEAIRERAAASALPPLNWLHVWWARRPLATSRAAVAASLLSASADRAEFYGPIGTHPGIVDEQPDKNWTRPRPDVYESKKHTPCHEHSLRTLVEVNLSGCRAESSLLLTPSFSTSPLAAGPYPSKQDAWDSKPSPTSSTLSRGLSSERPASGPRNSDGKCWNTSRTSRVGF